MEGLVGTPCVLLGSTTRGPMGMPSEWAVYSSKKYPDTIIAVKFSLDGAARGQSQLDGKVSAAAAASGVASSIQGSPTNEHPSGALVRARAHVQRVDSSHYIWIAHEASSIWGTPQPTSTARRMRRRWREQRSAATCSPLIITRGPRHNMLRPLLQGWLQA